MPPTPTELDVALSSLLQASLPGLFGGSKPIAGLRVASDASEITGRESETAVSAPRPTDQLDSFAFEKTKPRGPFTLTRPPYPGPRRVRLRSPDGVVALADSELAWDPVNPQILTLNLRASRDLAAVTAVEVLYGVTAVYTTVAAKRTLGIFVETQDADVARLPGAVALALAVIELNRDVLSAAAAVSYTGGDYGAASHVKRLRLVGVSAPRTSARLLTLEADVTLTVNRALRASDGAPIQHIRSPGRPLDPRRPVQIDIQVGA
jgi:hypothetical protein